MCSEAQSRESTLQVKHLQGDLLTAPGGETSKARHPELSGVIYTGKTTSGFNQCHSTECLESIRAICRSHLSSADRQTDPAVLSEGVTSRDPRHLSVTSVALAYVLCMSGRATRVTCCDCCPSEANCVKTRLGHWTQSTI
ncbi:hypothetical protein J6590_034115 [Homalodisca vitripennis]|nr:hypothetical protein J6590_034115 [Homalodisca vitripennis]